MIIRTKKTSGNFFIIHKTFIQDPNLSAKAKGIMTYILTLPDDWQIYIDELVKHFKDGRSSIMSGIKELEERGYLKKRIKRNENGQFQGYEYILYETPQNDTEVRKSEVGKSDFGKSDFGKSQTTNINVTNINDTNIKKLNNIAEKNSACLEKKEKKEDKKTAPSKNKKKKLTRENAAAENSPPQNENVCEKELKKLLTKIYAYKYYHTTGLKYPSKDYPKLMKLSQKTAEFLLKQYSEGLIDSIENLVYRAVVLVNFAFERKKTDPAYIYGKIAESYAELKAYSKDERPFYKQIVEKAVNFSNEMINEFLEDIEKIKETCNG